MRTAVLDLHSEVILYTEVCVRLRVSARTDPIPMMASLVDLNFEPQN